MIHSLRKAMYLSLIQFTLGALPFLVNPSPTFAGTFGVEMNGLSYHFSEPPTGAPRKIDSNGVMVFNPGLGIDYDFRANALQGGFSGIVRSGFFQDCQDAFAIYGGAGVRYRKFLNQRYFIGASLLGGIYSTVSEDEVMSGPQNNVVSKGSPSRTIMPLIVPGIETGFNAFRKDIIKVNFSYAPVLDLVLTSFTYSFSI
jgi:hypothetical protein